MHAEHRNSQNKTTYFRAADIFDFFDANSSMRRTHTYTYGHTALASHIRDTRERERERAIDTLWEHKILFSCLRSTINVNVTVNTRSLLQRRAMYFFRIRLKRPYITVQLTVCTRTAKNLIETQRTTEERENKHAISKKRSTRTHHHSHTYIQVYASFHVYFVYLSVLSTFCSVLFCFRYEWECDEPAIHKSLK